MSNISDIVQAAQGGRLAQNLAQRFGLADWQAEAAVAALVPALSAGFKKASEEPASLRPLVEAAKDPRHRAAFESADHAYTDAAVERGSEIVGQLFGSPATTGQIAQLASRESGVRADILQQLLPALAAIVAGGLHQALEKQGRGAALSHLSGEAPAAPTPEAPGLATAAPKTPAGLAALLTGFVTALFGRGAEPKAAAEAPPAAPSASEGDPLQEALDHIREALAPGAAVSADHQASLDDLFGRVFGAWKS